MNHKTMSSSTLILLSVILAVWLLPFGCSLKCFSYVCSNSSNVHGPTCALPQEFVCPSIPGSSIVFDRCMTQRFVFESSIPRVGVITVHQEIRNCSHSLYCGNDRFRELTCSAANSSGNLKECEAGCCQGDLCNSGGPIPTQVPRPTGPSGADLSCLACSNIPNAGVQRNCNDPIPQVCGAGPRSFFPQDRCMTVKAVAKMPGLSQAMKFEMKNCSNMAMCNPGAFCTEANKSVSGVIESCQISCCFGNLCNGNNSTMISTAAVTAATTAPRTTEGETTAGGTEAPKAHSSATTGALLTTSLTCFSAFSSYFYFIFVV